MPDAKVVQKTSNGGQRQLMHALSIMRAGVLGLALAAVGPVACAPLSEDETAEVEQPAVPPRPKAEASPSEDVERYIITVREDRDENGREANVAAVRSALQKAGAKEVEVLKGTRVIFVTADTEAIEAARESGLIESVQIDRLSRPYKD